MTTQEEDVKDVLCKHCDCYYPATKENFYTYKEKLKLHMCKECWREKSRENRKNKIPEKRERKVYMREYQRSYRLKKKLENEKKLNDSKDI
jgi:hypothetical protein